jgi:SHS family lactate transporter-like MFS transporter
VSLTVTNLSVQFQNQPSDITWGITLTLMLRSVGAAIFGIIGDRYGRKWPYIINLVLLIVLELATGFVQTFKQFLAVRALFGIAMGGMYGNASATALEDAPIAARGLLSGLLQQGYAFGNLLAAVFNLAITPNNPNGWRALFWFGAGPPVLLIIWRLYLPETDAFKYMQEERKTVGHENVAKGFVKQIAPALKQHGFRLVYLVLLMSGFNFMSHGSQDLYPTFLQRQLGYSTGKVTVTTVVSNLGAMCGGAFVGHMSTFLGRRLSIILASIVGAAVIPAWILVRNDGIMGAAFWEQFCVQGAWGYVSFSMSFLTRSVIPIHLLELSPAHFRSFVVGTSYQLGNLASSASSTIEATIGERFPLPPLSNGLSRYDYGKVMGIFMGCVFVYGNRNADLS